MRISIDSFGWILCTRKWIWLPWGQHFMKTQGPNGLLPNLVRHLHTYILNPRPWNLICMKSVGWVNHNLHEANPTPTTVQVVHFVAVISLSQKKAPEVSCSSDFQAVRVTCGWLGWSMGEKQQFLESTANLQETQRNIGDLRDTQQQGVIPIKASSLSLLPIPLGRRARPGDFTQGRTGSCLHKREFFLSSHNTWLSQNSTATRRNFFFFTRGGMVQPLTAHELWIEAFK